MNRVRAILLLAAAMAVASPVAAQDFPSRPVKIVLGFVPGGGVDNMARMLAAKLSESLGQNFIVENKPGASGLIAAEYVANAPGDGYTLLMGETSQLEAAPKNSRIKELTPVSLVTTTTFVLVANPKTSIRSLEDLLQAARANPGKLTIGTSGIGSIHHLATEAFAHGAGIKMTHVPYKGSGQSIHAILSGEVDLLTTSMTAAQTYITTDKLHLLATTAENRLPSYPDIPALATIVPGYDFYAENGLLAPPGLPPAIATKLAEAVRQALETPDFVRLIRGAPGTVNSWQSPAQYSETIVANRKKFAEALKLVGQSTD